ncbi:hypothetical protein GEV33_011852 [Tenebrio molitor]|uniref:Integrase catalytic domain-containing protein n=1 Tax=Tenebrio molitor TaxID=7067 RepID=A0A8J6L467_TENMO|nr:hypothetical protein GEV33_011852 [Tenebrio molitor]
MKKKGLVVAPILSNHMNSRCQIDLIDMQTEPDRDYRFILNYQDHLTKFTILKPLKTKTAEEVAYNVMDIFCIFGAPFILQSDNGREFSNKIIEAFKDLWPGLKLVHGKPRHSQSQGSVERSNQDVRDMLVAWMLDNKTKQCLCSRRDAILEQRENAKVGLMKQAEKMLALSREKLPPAEIGQNVVVKVPDVDRGRLAPRSVVAVVLSVNESSLYKLGTKEGVLERLYSRNEFTFADSNFINSSDVPSSSLNLRKASALSSGSKQGFVMCHCKRYCNTKKCNCRANENQVCKEQRFLSLYRKGSAAVHLGGLLGLLHTDGCFTGWLFCRPAEKPVKNI